MLCSDCDIIYCRSCVTDLDESSNLNPTHPTFISCRHESLGEILDINKRHLEKIKVRCFYNCKNHNLNLFNYSDHIRKCKISRENKTKHSHYGQLQTGILADEANDKEGYSSKLLLAKIGKLNIAFELTNQKLIDENEANKQLAQTFKTALIDERISTNIISKQMLNLIAAYKPIDENEIDTLENIETLIKEEQEEEIDLEKLLENKSNPIVIDTHTTDIINLIDTHTNDSINLEPFKGSDYSNFTVLDNTHTTYSINSEKFQEDFKNKEEFIVYLSDQLVKHCIPLVTTTTNKITRGEVLGEGSFGQVIRGTVDGNIVAIKLFTYVSYESKATIRLVLNEVLSMTKISHPGLPKFYGVFHDKQNKEIGLVLEFLAGVTLHEFVLGKPELKKNVIELEGYKQQEEIVEIDKLPQISDKEICKLLIEVCKICVSLHTNNIVHRDIKPKNVMVIPIEVDGGKTNKIVLYDFGIGFTLNNKFVPLYCPPEAFQDEGDDCNYLYKITPKFDVWSFGCMMNQLFTGKRSWSQFQDVNKVHWNLKRQPNNVYKNVDSKCPALPIIKRCCRSAIDDRIDSEELLVLLIELRDSL